MTNTKVQRQCSSLTARSSPERPTRRQSVGRGLPRDRALLRCLPPQSVDSCLDLSTSATRRSRGRPEPLRRVPRAASGPRSRGPSGGRRSTGSDCHRLEATQSGLAGLLDDCLSRRDRSGLDRLTRRPPIRVLTRVPDAEPRTRRAARLRADVGRSSRMTRYAESASDGPRSCWSGAVLRSGCSA